MNFRSGMKVRIEGHIVKLLHRLRGVSGGWVVSPGIGNPPMRMWNEDEMKPEDSGSSEKGRS